MLEDTNREEVPEWAGDRGGCFIGEHFWTKALAPSSNDKGVFKGCGVDQQPPGVNVMHGYG